MKVVNVIHRNRAMLSPLHANCAHPHKIHNVPTPHVPEPVDLTKLYTLVQELAVRLEFLEMDVCTQNFELNTVIASLQQQQQQAAQTTKTVGEVGIDIGLALITGL